MRKAVGWCTRALACLVVATGSAAWAESGNGLHPSSERMAWENLQGRLALGTSASLRPELGSHENHALRVHSLSLMGDYYLSRPWLGSTGGLRATSGVMLGSRTSLWSSPATMERRASGNALDDSTESTTTPYLGMGYTGLSAKGGWGLSADLGVMALNPRSGTRLGRVVNGTQNLDDAIRELRLTPLVQVGVSYSF